jgi:hypothetical protein
MHVKFLIAAFAATVSTAAVAAGPLDQIKGKMKPGLYDMKMEMEIPGMPAGMGKQTMNMQNCVTEKDIEQGSIGKSGKDGKPDNCEVKNVKVSGNTASYTAECKGDPQVTADSTITFSDKGYTMTTRSAMKQGGQVMNMTQKVDSRYVGPCKK